MNARKKAIKLSNKWYYTRTKVFDKFWAKYGYKRQFYKGVRLAERAGFAEILARTVEVADKLHSYVPQVKDWPLPVPCPKWVKMDSRIKSDNTVSFKIKDYHPGHRLSVKVSFQKP